ncbi:histidine kinase A-like protein [Novosphingobium nitrogenifigens DSM 19370]|uniref:histidine kinase n=1 Tax=Novosphingobium nitrogenifigens DSM 19370 TaxID=983920 RepID=F1Z3K9_9SPHN|nr:histidine kinase dimerization/phospho-acceptor domain-containing protein [Novosphingobium nitrogenifigens]EGD60823.1 histidine kinase A-like protein [Novosphingobium nitrogenifigens DSM 19370]
MIVDDRLETVLRTHAAGRTGLNTQFRQLADLLGRTPTAAWTTTHDRALARLDDIHNELGDAAAAVLLGLATLRSPRLIAHFAGKGQRSGIAAINRARLDDETWLNLIPQLPIQARGVLRHRRDLGAPVVDLLQKLGIDDFVLPVPSAESATESMAQAPVETPAEAVIETPAPVATIAQPPVQAEIEKPEPETPPTKGGVLITLPRDTERRIEPAAPREGIGAIVRRIEAFRRTRDTDDRVDEENDDDEQASLPLGETGRPRDPVATEVDISIDASGSIVGVGAGTVDPAMLVGHTPFVPPSPAATASVDASSLAAFRARLPIVCGLMTLDGAAKIAGVWRIDAAPIFGEDGGQFQGYRARLRRPPAARRSQPAPRVEPSSDMLQQMLHELRTPINAIQGFAELIQQQLFGPTPHQYRSLAASIAADAARMLAGFEDVERLVRLETGRATMETGETDLAAMLDRLAGQIEPLTAPREIRLRWSIPPEAVMVPLASEEIERTLWRLVSTLIGSAAPGERMTFALSPTPSGTAAQLLMTLPSALAMRDEASLFASEPARGGIVPGAAMLGPGFALRLCATELRAAGGCLERATPDPARGQGTSPALSMTVPLAAITLDRSAAAS